MSAALAALQAYLREGGDISEVPREGDNFVLAGNRFRRTELLFESVTLEAAVLLLDKGCLPTGEYLRAAYSAGVPFVKDADKAHVLARLRRASFTEAPTSAGGSSSSAQPVTAGALAEQEAQQQAQAGPQTPQLACAAAVGSRRASTAQRRASSSSNSSMPRDINVLAIRRTPRAKSVRSSRTGRSSVTRRPSTGKRRSSKAELAAQQLRAWRWRAVRALAATAAAAAAVCAAAHWWLQTPAGSSAAHRAVQQVCVWRGGRAAQCDALLQTLKEQSAAAVPLRERAALVLHSLHTGSTSSDTAAATTDATAAVDANSGEAEHSETAQLAQLQALNTSASDLHDAAETAASSAGYTSESDVHSDDEAEADSNYAAIGAAASDAEQVERLDTTEAAEAVADAEGADGAYDDDAVEYVIDVAELLADSSSDEHLASDDTTSDTNVDLQQHNDADVDAQQQWQQQQHEHERTELAAETVTADVLESEADVDKECNVLGKESELADEPDSNSREPTAVLDVHDSDATDGLGSSVATDEHLKAAAEQQQHTETDDDVIAVQAEPERLEVADTEPETVDEPISLRRDDIDEHGSGITSSSSSSSSSSSAGTGDHSEPLVADDVDAELRQAANSVCDNDECEADTDIFVPAAVADNYFDLHRYGSDIVIGSDNNADDGDHGEQQSTDQHDEQMHFLDHTEVVDEQVDLDIAAAAAAAAAAADDDDSLSQFDDHKLERQQFDAGLLDTQLPAYTEPDRAPVAAAAAAEEATQRERTAVHDGPVLIGVPPVVLHSGELLRGTDRLLSSAGHYVALDHVNGRVLLCPRDDSTYYSSSAFATASSSDGSLRPSRVCLEHPLWSAPQQSVVPVPVQAVGRAFRTAFSKLAGHSSSSDSDAVQVNDSLNVAAAAAAAAAPLALSLTDRGVLVISKHGKQLWHSGRSGEQGLYTALVRPDGVLCVLAADAKLHWSTLKQPGLLNGIKPTDARQ
jgi:hypothetical protein